MIGYEHHLIEDRTKVIILDDVKEFKIKEISRKPKLGFQQGEK